LNQVNFPDGLTRIGLFAFMECVGLTEVSLPATLTAIEDGAFYAVYADKHAGATSTAVEDAVTGSGTVLVAVSGEGSGRWKILSATSFEPTFAMAPDSSGSLSVVTAEGGVELWYERFEDGTLILLR
jgi:hypothetical protein